MSEIMQSRLGMSLIRTYVKSYTGITRNGEPKPRTLKMVVIKCSCDKEFETTLSKWVGCLIDSCKPCAIRKNKNRGVGVHSVRVKGGPSWKSVG